MKYGVKALAWGMPDVLVDGHFDVVQALDDEIEGLEDILFDQVNRTQQLQRRTFALRKSLVHVRRAVLPMREVVNALMRRDNDIPGELRGYYEDLYDHVLRGAEWSESLRDLVSSVFETNLSLQDARLNAIMKKLKSYTALIAIPMAVTGFYGQNVPTRLRKARRLHQQHRGDRGACRGVIRRVQAQGLAVTFCSELASVVRGAASY